MKLRKLFVTTIAAAVAVSAFGCGSSGAATSDQASESSTSGEAADIEIAEDDETAVEGATDEVASTNPITNYEGAYKVENKEEFYMLLEALDETDGVRATIINSDPDSDYVYWELYGTIDESLKITYEEGMKCKIAFTEDGEASEEIIYEDGTGSLQITDDKKVTWQDDKENAGGGLRICVGPGTDRSDQ